MENVSLEDVIRQYVHLPTMNSRGWYPCVHPICDHGNKGNRAAFLFDGDVTVFRCYNCSISTKYDPSTHKTMPNKMEKVLREFGIEQTELQQVVFSHFGKQINIIQTDSDTLQLEPKTIQLPEEFYLLSNATDTDPWAMIAKEYLECERGIDWTAYPFMLSKKSTNPHMLKWRKRLIVPIYKKNKLVFYQGRDLTEKAVKKYLNVAVDAFKVIYGFDKLFDYTNQSPLYIVEGWFDSFLLDGIAIFGNTISKEQAAWINKSKRPKVYIPDRYGSGIAAGRQALDHGWSISTPDIGSDTKCKDITDIVNKFGLIYTMQTLARNTASGFAAETQLAVYCKK